MNKRAHNLGKQTPKQLGAVVILFIIMLPFLLMMMALALDTGNLFVAKTELQNAADSCALSAGQELNGTLAQFNSAQAAGLLAGNSNKFNLQKYFNGSANGATIAVTFAQNLNDSAASYIAATGGTAANANTYKYVRCEATGTVNKFLAVPGLGNSDTLAAQAIASQVPAQIPCVLPVSICSSAIAGAAPGAWVGGLLGNGGGPNSLSPTVCNGTNGPNCSCNGGSCFRWVHFGSGTGSASELATLLTGNNSCNIKLTGQTVSNNVPTAGTYNDYNTRFGLKQTGGPTATINPDFTGFGYTPVNFPPANNAYINDYNADTKSYLTNKKVLTPNQGGLSGYTVVPPTASNATARRIGIAPVVNCAVPGTVAQTVNTWACILMLNPVASAGGPTSPNRRLYLEFLGTSAAGACAQIGLAGNGGTGPTVSALVQ